MFDVSSVSLLFFKWILKNTSETCLFSIGWLITTELQDSLPDCKELPAHKKEQTDLNTSTSGLKFPTTTSNYAVGMARTSKTDFVRLIDTGVPVDLPKENDADVLVLYGKDTALPKTYNEEKEHATTSSIPALETEQALEGCEFLNIVLTDHSKQRNQCIAIVPQYESYHVQKWMRQTQQEGEHGVDHNAPLVPVSRGVQTNGREKFKPPLTKDIQQNWELLSKYFQSYHASLEELKPLVEKVATPKKTVTVMVCNFGQSMLLMNFVCAARSRNLDTSSILVFATDLETKALAESLGLTAFYDERVRCMRFLYLIGMSCFLSLSLTHTQIHTHKSTHTNFFFFSSSSSMPA